ncbi:OmpA family protein [Sulfitobacter sp. M57]|uniref:OmpA family protein n=1 Tax=unclassified Sulfitobacter TaxID=196795 RepID=UPI0023E12E75|nr:MULTISPECIES: OmpA family protein [unclassified Sulfitobacter]MDF3416305.1 OmpA family protein [Sulfitobacter sp. KE5]MDF3423784.1 OmpA family protein [Sulfitobacter sp. KE43]MDF3434851.1 OmpA family protein [Sulfitobacter sp. KE42]MDF3460490.1 OmpA family protein [Sulfitobacter sp. S74]MDF3464388.1 OmpA family protein [Sulfitobacter sp. Ks18]
MPPPSPFKPASRHGRPGLIRALASGAIAVLLGVGALTALRVATGDVGPDVIDRAATPQRIPDLEILAMARMVSPPAPGSFSIGEVPAQVSPVVPPSDDDCVQTLHQALSSTIVRFDSGSFEITPQHIAGMARISDRIMACETAYVMVGGHADGGGDDAANLALSWERADRTLNHLLLLGVDPAAIEAVGYGARAPLSQGSNEDDGSDHRVDFKVMRKP